MKKFTDKQIIEALKCCIAQENCEEVSCEICPYDKFYDCKETMLKNVLDIFNRKNAEIKRLEKESLDKEKTYNNEYFLRREIEDELKYVRDEYHKENKELKKIIKRQEQLINKIEGGCANMEEFKTNRNVSEEYRQWVVDMCQAYGDGANVLLSAIPLYQLQIGAQLQRNAAKERDQQDVCPICGYVISDCQCRYGGSKFPDVCERRRVIFDHLYLLSSTQLNHVINLQRQWQTSYGDSEKNAILSELLQRSYEASMVEGKETKSAIPIDMNRIKSEAIKKFAERLKNTNNTMDKRIIPTERIDKLVKEMTEEESDV